MNLHQATNLRESHIQKKGGPVLVPPFVSQKVNLEEFSPGRVSAVNKVIGTRDERGYAVMEKDCAKMNWSVVLGYIFEDNFMQKHL